MDALGARLRQIRQGHGWTLKEVASRSGLSVGFLSQVERGLTTLSIVSLHRICRALGVDMVGLLAASAVGRGEAVGAEGAGGSPVVPGRDQLEVRIGGGPVSYRRLSGSFPGRMTEALENVFPPGHRQPPSTHEGEEFGLVLAGSLTLRVDGVDYELGPGDAFHFATSRPHGYATPAGSGARVLVVSTASFLNGRQDTRDERSSG